MSPGDADVRNLPGPGDGRSRGTVAGSGCCGRDVLGAGRCAGTIQPGGPLLHPEHTSLHFAKNDDCQRRGFSREFQGLPDLPISQSGPQEGIMVRHGPEISEKRGVDRLLIVSVFAKCRTGETGANPVEGVRAARPYNLSCRGEFSTW